MAPDATCPLVDPARVLADLRELAALTGGPAGARRVCWTAEWRAARGLVERLLGEIGLDPERDEAGNVWAQLEGEDPGAPAVAVGSHIDSVPAGGWLDGALGVLAAVGVLRAWAHSGRRPPRTLALVDFADEEGARFGRSLFGSSAVAGTLDPAALAPLRDRDGTAIADALAENGVDLERAPLATARRERLGAFLELHVEQGPVLEREGLAVAAVDGCAGVERHRFAFAGQASHAGTTPMDARRDAGLAAADAALRIERLPRRAGGVATTGALALEPGIATAVAGRATLTVDLRHPEREALAGMLAGARGAAASAAAARGCEVAEEAIWSIEPIPFDPELVGAARAACATVTGVERTLTSGALHDAAELARAVPTAMVFCSSRAGISHAPEEDTAEADIVAGIECFGRLANATLSGGGA